MDTYKSSNDLYFDNKRPSLYKTEKSYNVHNHDYLTHYDQNYVHLLKQYNRESFVEEPQMSIVNINTCNTMNGRRIEGKKDPSMPYSRNDKNMNASNIGLSNSDDEALDDYLHALAKNYDDIDRRIRNAERFVNQMDDTLSSDGILKNGFTKSNNLGHTIDKNVKYVTELRVNIADSIKNNNIVSNYQERFIDVDNSTHSSIGGQTKKLTTNHHSPVLKKRSSIPITSYSKERNNSRKLRNKVYRENFENQSDYFEVEQVIVPPPILFRSNEVDMRITMLNKNVQTDDICIGMFPKPEFESREVQTLPIEILVKKTSDVGVVTDNPIIIETPKSECLHKAISSDSSFMSKSDISNQASKSMSQIESENMSKNTALLPNMDSKEGLKKSFSMSYNAQPCPTKKVSENNTKDTAKTVLEHSAIGAGNKVKSKSDKSRSILRADYSQDGFDHKDSSKNASQEIQRLLENLGSHLKASVSFRDVKRKENKEIFSESSGASFWDNPLQKKDILSSKQSPVKILKANSTKKTKKTNNVINSELQAICRTIESKIKKENKHSKISHQSSESENDYNDRIHNNNGTLRSESLDTRGNLRNPVSIQNYGIIKKSTSNLNLSGDNRFPGNYKISKSFDLNPYDDIIKSHLSPIDRRLKSVASKNGCSIIVEGPLNAYDATISQSFRNKIMYRCTIAGACKDNLDKCINYLKETFPNTFLKNNSRP